MREEGDSFQGTVARLLVVDDEETVREGLRWSLHLSGFQVEEAESGPVALAWLGRAPFDVMVVDMAMPGMGGVEVMLAARRLQPDLAILILTGHATLESAIAAVKAGAADYLLKPVSVHDLKETVMKALRKQAERRRQQQAEQLLNRVRETLAVEPGEAGSGPATEPASPQLRYGRLTLDVEKRAVTVDGPDMRKVMLTAGETAILRELLKHPEQVRSCRQLVKAAWDYDMLEIEATSMVRSYIYRLRKKIERDAEHPRMLRTVRGGGYYLAADQSGD